MPKASAASAVSLTTSSTIHSANTLFKVGVREGEVGGQRGKRKGREAVNMIPPPTT